MTDDNQTNNGSTERGHAQADQVNTVRETFEERSKTFVRDNARKDYDYLKYRLSEQVKLRNTNKGDLPEFVMVGSQTVQLGHVALKIHLQQSYHDPDTYFLEFGLGSASPKTTMFGPGPTAKSGNMRATASHDVRILLWSSDQLGQLESEDVVEFLLDWLTGYYHKHKPK